VAERTTTLAFILKDSASKGMRELNKTARSLEKTAGSLNAPFAAAAKGFAIAGAAAVAVGGAMFAAAKAAAEEDASIARLNATISANTKITDAQTKEMDAAIEARQNLAFSDDALRDSLSRLVPRTKDVSKAIELQAIAMDFARLRGVDLSTASDLVGKVFSGNTSILSRYGFTVEKGTTATQALAMIQKAAAGQAEAYGQTTQGAMESIQIAIDNIVEDIALTTSLRISGASYCRSWQRCSPHSVTRLCLGSKSSASPLLRRLRRPLISCDHSSLRWSRR